MTFLSSPCSSGQDPGREGGGMDILIRIDDGGATWAARELSKESVADFFEVIDPPFFESVLASLDSGGCDRRIDV